MIKAKSIAAASSASSIILPTAGLLACAVVMLTLGSPAAAAEQCRFIQGKAEREACYQRQEADLTAKRTQPEPRRAKTMEPVEQMDQEDAALDRQIHSICRGC
jgi:hypothetical protein